MTGFLDGDLYTRLRAMAAESPSERAALAVLHVHGLWLPHAGFVDRCIETVGGCAWVDWPQVRAFGDSVAASALDREVLRLAVELASDDDRARLDQSVVFDEHPSLRAALHAAIVRRGAR